MTEPVTIKALASITDAKLTGDETAQVTDVSHDSRRAGEGTLFAAVAGALFAYLKGSVFPDSLSIPLSVDALVMVLLGGVETVSGGIVGAVVYKALNIWLVNQTDLSKLVLGAFIVLIVVAFPKGIVGVLEMTWFRQRHNSPNPGLLSSRIETAE